MKEGIGEKVFKASAIALTMLLLVGGLIVAWPTYRRSCALQSQQAELSSRIDEKKLRIAELQELQRRFQTDSDLVEAIARKNGRVFPGELVFIFDEDQGR